MNWLKNTDTLKKLWKDEFMKDHFVKGLDICECGDYRKDHKNRKGQCRFNGGLGHGVCPPCLKFKFSNHHPEDDL